MEILLKKATMQDIEQIHEMQINAFKPLLDKYQDYETSPGAESVERVKRRMEHPQVSCYFIQLKSENIGHIRITMLDENTCLLSQMCILPQYQENGYAQRAIKQVEALYPKVKKWMLDTIKQEPKLCHLYEKMGYKLTGEEKNIKDGMDLVDYAKHC